MKRWVTGLLSLFVLGCASKAGMEGAYRGPERIGKERYEVVRPNVDLQKNVRVVLLTFSDARPSRPDLDWTRQANIYSDAVGQPVEVRPELEKAIEKGLSSHAKITLIPASSFLKNRQADVVISGKILKSEAHRGTDSFVGHTILEVTLRDEFGNPFWKASFRAQGVGKTGYRDTGFYDEIEPGKVGDALTESIEAAVNDLLQKPIFTQTLSRAQSGPDRDLAAENFGSRVSEADGR